MEILSPSGPFIFAARLHKKKGGGHGQAAGMWRRCYNVDIWNSPLQEIKIGQYILLQSNTRVYVFCGKYFGEHGRHIIFSLAVAFIRTHCLCLKKKGGGH